MSIQHKQATFTFTVTLNQDLLKPALFTVKVSDGLPNDLHYLTPYSQRQTVEQDSSIDSGGGDLVGEPTDKPENENKPDIPPTENPDGEQQSEIEPGEEPDTEMKPEPDNESKPETTPEENQMSVQNQIQTLETKQYRKQNQAQIMKPRIQRNQM